MNTAQYSTTKVLLVGLLLAGSLTRTADQEPRQGLKSKIGDFTDNIAGKAQKTIKAIKNNPVTSCVIGVGIAGLAAAGIILTNRNRYVPMGPIEVFVDDHSRATPSSVTVVNLMQELKLRDLESDKEAAGNPRMHFQTLEPVEGIKIYGFDLAKLTNLWGSYAYPSADPRTTATLGACAPCLQQCQWDHLVECLTTRTNNIGVKQGNIQSAAKFLKNIA